MDEGEDRRRRPDAQPEHRDYDGGESRAAPQPPRHVVQVADETVEPAPAQHGARVLPDEGGVSKTAARGASGGIRSYASVDEPVALELHVEAHLLLEVVVGPSTAEVGNDAEEPSRPRHRSPPIDCLNHHLLRQNVNLGTECRAGRFHPIPTNVHRLGGNLKEGVLTPDTYDPTLNPLYRDVLAHYGVVALPCRVRDPDRKGKVEAGVGHAKRTPLRGLRFEDLDDAQAYLDRWERRWADTRTHGTTKRQVAAMFAEEKPALGPLPLEPYRYYQSPHGAPGRLRRGRVRLLRGAAGMDRPSHPRPVERSPRPAARSPHRPAPPRAPARAAGLAPHRGPRPARTHPADDSRPARRRQAGRPRHLEHLRPDPPSRRRRRCPSHPRRPRPRQEARPRRRRRGGRRRPRARRCPPTASCGATSTAGPSSPLHHAHVLKCGPRSWRPRSRRPCGQKEAVRQRATPVSGTGNGRFWGVHKWLVVEPSTEGFA